ncbi:uncharacterized protein LOC107274761 [Cephus cinctus]|uniref:Uncharacterized protein LOC107274761 n=1 Tax=Cephus cinctus TaxID=211228 RepID=A0AAJ7FV09_CEPCN|nr:uncharacterized protein LOC107274761 [Cephus cinctus]XP_015609733.1 uncharacterized protein LOC107274761 [Cephus cinctus]XP_015609735.1 uncharacterized protein LOC107274761 [Cephus cinctus]XP_024947676.1 uncharacterized protein LOC107274761 [Cephus cinctus]
MMVAQLWTALTVYLLAALSKAVASGPESCGIPNNFSVLVAEGQKVDVYGAELWVGIKTEDVAITTYPDRESARLLANNTMAAFRAHIVHNDFEEGIKSESQRVSQVFDGLAYGDAKLIPGENGTFTIRDCKLILPRNSRGDIPAALDNEIRHKIELCLGPMICANVGARRLSENVSEEYFNDFGPSSYDLQSAPILHNDLIPNLPTVDMQSRMTTGTELDKTSTYQSTINILVDIAVAELIHKLREKNEGTIPIPNIEQYFMRGNFFRIGGYFQAFNGTFSDLTTIRRVDDATLSHDGFKFTASCGFGLPEAHLHYDSYKVKLAFIKVKGEFTGDVNGVALDSRITVDYTQRPCTKTLDRLQVTEFGKIHLRVTGLGPLNYPASVMLNWLTKKWRDEIVLKVENKLQKVAVQQLDKFNCERFRPRSDF